MPSGYVENNELVKRLIKPEFKDLPYTSSYNEKFTSKFEEWVDSGYHKTDRYEHFTAYVCSMKTHSPYWALDILKWFEVSLQVRDCVFQFYRMPTDTIHPVHTDPYGAYRNLYNCTVEQCVRCIIFLEDWKSGHYLEVNGTPVANWKCGDAVWWTGDTPHMAANMGLDDRYTLQLTGRKR